jgi:hypothetical protein
MLADSYVQQQVRLKALPHQTTGENKKKKTLI